MTLSKSNPFNGQESQFITVFFSIYNIVDLYLNYETIWIKSESTKST